MKKVDSGVSSIRSHHLGIIISVSGVTSYRSYSRSALPEPNFRIFFKNNNKLGGLFIMTLNFARRKTVVILLTGVGLVVILLTGVGLVVIYCWHGIGCYFADWHGNGL